MKMDTRSRPTDDIKDECMSGEVNCVIHRAYTLSLKILEINGMYWLACILS